MELTDITFRNNEHVLNVIDRIVTPLGRTIDEANPMVDIRLPTVRVLMLLLRRFRLLVLLTIRKLKG